jgi:hypothetical protein
MSCLTIALLLWVGVEWQLSARLIGTLTTQKVSRSELAGEEGRRIILCQSMTGAGPL